MARMTNERRAQFLARFERPANSVQLDKCGPVVVNVVTMVVNSEDAELVHSTRY